MPFSDSPPPIVYPDTYTGRQDARKAGLERGLVGFCSEYERDTHLSMAEARRLRGASRDTRIEDVNLCKNRYPMGERRHNWCFRCPAGFILVIDEHKTQADESAF